MIRRWVLVRLVAACLLALTTTTSAVAQPARDGRLLITVVDQTNAILSGATVTVTGADETSRRAVVAPTQTAANGIATIGGVPPGRYDVRAEFPGFDAGTLKEVRVRAGDNRHIIVLAIEKMQEAVTVARDAQTSAADRNGPSFGTTLTREQLDALSDDPDEMQRQLQEMAGPGAVIRIDSFEGGRLPPKSQIKSIHITRDQFAAENHGAEGMFVDIITQPGIGPIRTNMNYQAHNSAMTSRNAFSAVKGADQVQNYGINMSGALIRDKASFSLGVRGNYAFESPIVARGLVDGSTQSQTLLLKAPRNNRFVNANFDYAVTRDQTLRLSYNQSDYTSSNQGIGGFNEPERAYTTENRVHTFRVQEAGPLGRRFFTNTRVNVGWTDTGSTAALEAPTIRVLDAFTSGGAQVAGGRHSRDVNIASDLDYVRGIHSVRAGTAVDINRFRSDDTSNYLGTYVFESLDAYAAGLPRTYTRRIGDPSIRFTNVQAAVYLQDDIRVRRSLTLTPGVRYETQTHLRDRGNVAPRFGVTWAPFKNGKTTLRTSWGLFYDWLSTTTYEQTLRVDGVRQRELQIVNPTYPDPGSDLGVITAVNRYVLDAALENPRSARTSVGVDYGFTQRLHAAVTYRYVRNSTLLRGENLNAPVDGVRPDPAYGNVIEVIDDGRGRQHILQFTAQTPPPPPPLGGGPRWDWKRWGFFSGYTYTRNRNNTDGAFSTPATGTLDAEWGIASGSVAHRVNAGFTSSALRNFSWQLDGQFTSGTPYTIQTGLDNNADSIFNDRPAGVARNTGRGDAQLSLNLFAGYSFTFGPRVTLAGGPMIYGTPAGLGVTSFTPPEQGRYRIGLTVSVQNLTNRANYVGYSGVLTSPFFGKPTGAMNPRRVNVGLQFGF
jgi:hypothetical protein